MASRGALIKFSEDGLDDEERAELAAARAADAAREAEALAARRQLVAPVVRARAVAFVAAERELEAKDRFRLTMKARVLTQRVEKHLDADRAITALDSDIRENMSKGMRSQQALDSLEARLLKLRASMRASNDRADEMDAIASHEGAGDTFEAASLRNKLGGATTIGKAKSAALDVAEELRAAVDADDMERCPKCSKRYLFGMLTRHLEECDSKVRGADSDSSGNGGGGSDEEGDSGDDAGAARGGARGGGAGSGAGAPPAAAEKLQQCPVCMRKYYEARFLRHMKGCVKKKKLSETLGTAYGQGNAVVPEQYADVPSEPREVRMLAPTSSSISVAWEAPLWDGGQPIYDYQIEYFQRVYSSRAKGKEAFDDQKQLPVTTSRWLMHSPVAHKGFAVTNLPADTEIVRLRVRAVNVRGPGAWSAVAPVVRTLPATLCSPPLHVRYARAPAPSQVFIEWEEPFDAGGLTIFQYEIRYAQRVTDFATAVRLGTRFARKLVEKATRIAAPASAFTIAGLFGGAVIADVRVLAITAAGLSPPSRALPDITTPPMEREEVIAVELEAKRAMRELEVEVWLHDTAQRLNRLRYIEMLEAELAALRAHKARAALAALELAAAVEEERALTAREKMLASDARADAAPDAAAAAAQAAAQLAAAYGFADPLARPAVEHAEREAEYSLEARAKRDAAEAKAARAKAEDEAEAAAAAALAATAAAHPLAAVASLAKALPGAAASAGAKEAAAHREEAHVRRDQFLYRIEMSNKLVNASEEQMLAMATRKSNLKLLLVNFDRRVAALRGELFRLRDSSALVVETSVLGGAPQLVPLGELRTKLGFELAAAERHSQTASRELFDVDARNRAFKKRRNDADAVLEERRRALAAFEALEAKVTAMFKYGVNVKAGVPFKVFAAWRAASARTRARKVALRRVCGLFVSRPLKDAFRDWRAHAREAARATLAIAVGERRRAKGGLGTMLLAEAERQRGDAETDAMKMLGWLRAVEVELDKSNEDAAFRRVLRGVDATVTRGAVRSGAPSAEALGAAQAHRAIGPAFAFTQPLAVDAADVHVLPPLALLDDYVPVPALKELSAVQGTDVVLSAKAMAAFRTPQMIGDAYWAAQRRRRQLDAHGPSALLQGGLGDEVEAWARARLAAAMAFHDIGEHDRAVLAAKQAEQVWGFKRDAGGLLAVYRLLSLVLEALKRFDLGIIHWGRCVELAGDPDVADPIAQAEAYEGRGRCLLRCAYLEDALAAYEKAETIFEVRNDLPALARLYKAQAECLHAMRFYERAEALRARASDIQNRTSLLIRAGVERLAALEQVVAGAGIAESRRVQLELAGPALPLLHQQLTFVESELCVLRRLCQKAKQAFKRNKALIDKLQDEAVFAGASEAQFMESALLTGAPQRYPLNELRILLRSAQERAARQAEVDGKRFRELSTRETIAMGDVVDVKRWLGAEKRELAELVAARTPLAVVALNAANDRRLAADVLGVAEAASPLMAAGSGSCVFTHSMLDGKALSCFVGAEDREAATGAPVGHTRRVTALAVFGDRVFSGSADATIRVWDAATARGWGKRTPVHVAMQAEGDAFIAAQRAEERLRREAAEKVGEDFKPQPLKKLEHDRDAVRARLAGLCMTLLGHTGAVSALAVNERVLVSGGADKLVLVWDTRDGRLLRKLRGHDATVSAVALDDAFFATGSFDTQVRLWKITAANDKNPAQTIEMSQRLVGHAATVTAVAIRGSAVVSADATGAVIVWNAATGAPLRTHRVHEKSVTCLAFDSTKIISAALDRKVIFSDIASGEPIITQRAPHGESSVLALAFDAARLVTVGADHSLRLWAFHGAQLPAVRTLALRASEQLTIVARRYSTTVSALMRWNYVTNANEFFEGMRVVLAAQPGTPGYALAKQEAAQLAAAAVDATVGEAIFAAEETARAEAAAAADAERDEQTKAFQRAGITVLGAAGSPAAGAGAVKSVQLTPPKRSPGAAADGASPDAIKPHLPPLTPKEKTGFAFAARAGAKVGLTLAQQFALAEASAAALGLSTARGAPADAAGGTERLDAEVDAAISRGAGGGAAGRADGATASGSGIDAVRSALRRSGAAAAVPRLDLTAAAAGGKRSVRIDPAAKP